MDTAGIGIGDNGQVSVLGQAQGTVQTPPVPPTVQGTTEGTSDQANLSQGSQLMGELKNLQSTDPAKFKAVAQKISDSLAADAKNSSDPQQSKMLNSLSGKFADAAKSGDMSSLQFQHHKHSGQGQKSGSLGQAYGGQHSPGSMFSEVNGIISNALASAGVDANSTTATSAATAAATTVSSADETSV